MFCSFFCFSTSKLLLCLSVLSFVFQPQNYYCACLFFLLFFNLKTMRTMRETIQHPLKAWKFIVFPTTKTGDHFFSTLMKTILTLSTVASLFLFLFFAFSTQSRTFDCPNCDRILKFYTHRSYVNTDVISNTMAASRRFVEDEKTNISHILFGIGGSASTWNERRHYNELWWKPNVTRGFVWLDEKPFENQTWHETSPPYKVSSDTSRFNYTCWYGSRSAIRIARIVKESFELGLSNVRWFVMGDDDTVFFTENLVTVLNKYDHTQMYYIGGNSESVEQNVIHSYNMGYGGGGFAISYSLAKELIRVLDGCIDRYAAFYGSDQKIQGCMSEIGIPVTKELGFHQVDIRGNPYGFLAAHPVAPLVSLHHLDYVEPIFPGMTRIDSIQKLVNAYKSDPNQALQHSFCYDLRRNWTVSVSWDYTVQLYPYLATAKNLEMTWRTFQSWRSWSIEPFTFDTRPMNDVCERPIVYLLDRVESAGMGRIRTTYRRFVEEIKCDRVDYVPALGVEFFNVSTSKFNPDLWNKAPRRQCCEVINDPDGVESVVQVKIRGCNHFESVTPP